MALTGCMSFMKYLVLVFNLIVWLIGLMVLSVGVWLRLDPQTMQFVNALDGLQIYYIGTYVLIGAGGLMTIVGFVGCCGAFQESACMLGTFFIFLFLILCGEISAGVLAFLYNQRIAKSINDGFKRSVQKDYGDLGRTQSIDYVQRTLECCGGESPYDYPASDWYKNNNNGRLPKTCCKKDVMHLQGQLEEACDMTGLVDEKHLTPAAHQVGCGPKLIEFFQEHLHIMIGVSLGVASIQVLGLIFSIVLCCALCKDNSYSYDKHGEYMYSKAN
ncbi:CD9 antigen-like [Tubulanus polymorphus]|uniref:CD9 antigen-like n=1 Tax=Tubulanus polymorphus TaxID=672921 RepID=UPI003DA697C9